MARPKKNADPSWTYPYQTRQQIENLRIYFELHLPNRIRSWKQQTDVDTHAMPRINGKWGTGIPWESVPPHFRPEVERWFQMMLKRTKAQRGTLTAGKIRSLRMNAANYGRNVLTMKRNANRVWYERRKKQWLQYKEWVAERENIAARIARGPAPNRRLEIG